MAAHGRNGLGLGVTICQEILYDPAVKKNPVRVLVPLLEFNQHMKDARLGIPTPALLAKTVEKLDAVRIEDRNTKGDVYEYMLSEIATAGQNGQFRTPHHIIALMVELTEPKVIDIACDPAAGTCSFLVACGEYWYDAERPHQALGYRSPRAQTMPGFEGNGEREHMPEIDDLIREVIRSNASADDKTKIIQVLLMGAPADRWGINRYVIWGLIAVIVMTVIGVVITWGRATGNLTEFKVPEGLVALATTALGALAAYLVPPSHPAATTLTTSAGGPAAGSEPATGSGPASDGNGDDLSGS